ncbi:rho guanine nucleotide exchange factor 7-like [Belonocnema kinseyi]|uniref:rho guanine nucleotide exchange factor 7-like n=1 Tax=Belonocnema kinseyi TaxID=2817044 RepID=UPI00143CF4BC|nr:rho guanine nucleotide exchange factor 7-like [Belonocnema kinseyi]
MSKSDSPKLVTALFSFKGRNNDELCFKKGDIITITQTDDGGWWEGTFQEKTGWFPSNYVKEYRIPEPGHALVKLSPEKSPPELPVHQKLNRDIVLKDIIDSERANVAELQGLVTNFLQPLEASNILKKEEYKQLIGNIHEVLETHQRLLSNLDSALLQGADARVGNLFLTIAPRLKSIHSTYCNCHPQAVCILDRYRDDLNEFMERSGAISPGILVLTTGLSKPFRRLDKYSAMLQELERHTEKNHPDRGDTQRSVCVYREINEQCASARKQRELALQILTSGIKGWEGEELNSLGDILHVGPVTLVMGAERRDRYFVLFPTTLLVLSTSSRMSSFVYEGKLPLTGIHVVPLENTEETKNAFEISGPMIENITVFCTQKEDRQQWIDLLSQEQGLGLLRTPTLMPHVSCTHPPFTRLSRYYARLVRKKIIHPELMKKLLYLQYIYKPDLSDVKMRKCTVTYNIYPRNSQDYRSETSSLASSYERNNVETKKQRSLHKSTLLLDVRYVLVEDTPLQAQKVQLPPTSSASLAIQNSESRDDRFSLEASKSLPATVTSSQCFQSNLDATQFRDNENLTEAVNLQFGEDELKNWRSLDQTRHLASDELSQSFHEMAAESRLMPTASLRSSDSGMADSCHFNSSEINSSYKSSSYCRGKYADPVRTSHSGSENDEKKFEYQCICSSPFGSTPRESSVSSAALDFNTVVSRWNLADSTSVNCEPIFVNDETLREEDFEFESDRLDESAGGFSEIVPDEMRQKRFTQPGFPASHQRGKRVHRGEARERTESGDHPQGKQVYTSGLYAHWWLKKAIPLPETTDEAMLWEATNQPNVKQYQQVVEIGLSPGIKTPWSLASLRPAPPIYTIKSFGKSDSTESCRSTKLCNERQFEDDAIILKVIEGYCFTVNARFTVHSAMLDYDPLHKARDRVSLGNSKIGNGDSIEDRGLSETVKTLKNQMVDLQWQISQLTRQLEEERRSRLSLAATVKRSIAVIDGPVP